MNKENLQCPECQAEMLEKCKDNVWIDFCESCGGIFLDFGEICELAKSNTGKGVFREIQTGDDQEDHKGSFYACPKCESQMTEREYAFDSGIHIDWCGNCNGMYLNGGELMELKKYLASIDGGSVESKKNLEKGCNLLLKHKAEYEEKEKIHKKEIDNLYKFDNSVVDGIVKGIMDNFFS